MDDVLGARGEARSGRMEERGAPAGVVVPVLSVLERDAGDSVRRGDRTGWT
ncbi:MAG: hypothetical protein M3328_17040 [Chloroflexota bacterium]|nr:hypothetical protein [Chloroflexota bacterium]